MGDARAEQKLALTDIFDDHLAGESVLGRAVRPLSEVPGSRAERILITIYDPSQPMKAHYLPESLADDGRFVWVFDHGDMVDEIIEGLPAAGGEDAAEGGGRS